MKLDLHVHSQYSWDSSVPIEDYISKAEKLNFSAISIADHNDITSHSIIDKLQQETEVILIPGQEISTNDGHLLVYGWTELIPSGLSMEESVSIAQKQEGICIAAHPFDPFRGGFFSGIFETNIDGFELLNASAWFSFPNWLAKRAYRSHQDLIGLGNSDSHRIEEFGSAYSVIDTGEFHSVDQVIASLSQAKPEGHRIGKIAKLSRFIRRKF